MIDTVGTRIGTIFGKRAWERIPWMNESARFGKWEVVERISRGGQGQVYLVRDVSGAADTTERWKKLQKAITTLNGASEKWWHEEAGSQLADEIRQIIGESQLPKGALKELLPFEEGAAADEAAALDVTVWRPGVAMRRFTGPRIVTGCSILPIEGALPIFSEGAEPDVLFRLGSFRMRVIAPTALGCSDPDPARGPINGAGVARGSRRRSR